MTNAERPLGQVILSHLRSTPRDAWSIDSLSAIQSFLSGNQHIQGIGEPIEKALRLWMDLLPAHDADRIRSAMPQTTWLFLGAMLPALTVWAREQDWRGTVDMHDINTLCLKILTVLPENQQITDRQQLEAAALATLVLKDVVHEVTDRNDAWALVGPWLMSSGYSFWPREQTRWQKLQHDCDVFFDIWTNLAVASQHVDDSRQPADRSTPLVHRWETALNGPWPHLDFDQERALTRRFIGSELVDNLKKDLCSLVQHASTLADSNIRAFMETQLPTEEKDRIDVLPWHKKNKGFNEELASMYVPHTASLVGVLGTPEIWGDVAQAKSLLKSLTASNRTIPVLALPCGAFEDPPKP